MVAEAAGGAQLVFGRLHAIIHRSSGVADATVDEGALMAYFCHSCGNEQIFDVKVGVKVGRHDSCPHCGADLHVCKNCRLYDPNLHNKCREPEAAFIRDRTEANFCTHFDFKDSEGFVQDTSTVAARAKLEALFKNLK